MTEQWRPTPSELKTIRGMIIDRNDAWRADAEMAPVIDTAIRKGIRRDREVFWRIYQFLWSSGLPGSYETYGFDEQQMRKAWRRYYKKHYPKPVDNVGV